MAASKLKIAVVLAGIGSLGAAAYFYLGSKTPKSLPPSGDGGGGPTPDQLMSLLRDPAARARAQAQASAAGATSVGTNRLLPVSPVMAGAGVMSAIGTAIGTAIGGPIVGAVVGAVITFLTTVLPALLGAWVGTVPGDPTPPVDWLTPEGAAVYARDGIVATIAPDGRRVIVTRWGVFDGVSATVEGQAIVVVRADGTKRTVIDAGALRATLDRMWGAGAPAVGRRPVPPPPVAVASWLTSAQRAQYDANGGYVVVTVPDSRYNTLRGQRVVVTPTSIVPGIAAVLQPDPTTAGRLKLTVLDAKGLVRSVITFAPVRYGVSGVLGQSIRRVG